MRLSNLLFTLPCLLTFACSNAPADDEGSDLQDDEAELKKGEASLVVPLLDEKKKLLSRWNDKAKEKGFNETPDTMEMKNTEDAKKIFDAIAYFQENVQEAVGATNEVMSVGHPADYTNWSKSSKRPGLCYRGNPLKVADVIASGVDYVFSEQLVMSGWRYKKSKNFAEGSEEFESSFPDVWTEWRGDGTAVLYVASQSDDGDDLTPAIIPRCKKSK